MRSHTIPTWRGALMATLLMAWMSAPAAAASTRTSFVGVLVTTAVSMPEHGPGSEWSSAGVWHVRGAHVRDAVFGEHIGGSLERSVSFNLNTGTGESTAWCSFVWSGEVDEWTGSCRGSLLTGTFGGRGAAGSQLFGVYELAPGGVPAIGPYLVTGEILHPGA